ncbi:unnamed protein product [Urochloa decumbens]|uniref:VWFA domain-containing protein n=1 Tax=Urochloa decumbens TaxID=240449 RepID=A0ABC9AMI7_9POAL
MSNSRLYIGLDHGDGSEYSFISQFSIQARSSEDRTVCSIIDTARKMGKHVIINARNNIKLTIISNSPKLPSGEQGDIPVLLQVEAPQVSKKHVPVDLVALIDVSGSMNIEVAPGITRLDLLKKAMKFVIDHLHEDDGLAIMPLHEKILTDYSTDLLRISSQRAVAQNMVHTLVAKGNTAFVSPGLELAVKILDERSDNNRVGVVMLLTDGLDSRKEAMNPIRPEVLQKYPVHTIGICAHDPNVLLSIAQKSFGTYSSVDDNELGKITNPFAVLLGGLSSIVAVDVVVRISCHSCWRSAVKWIDCGFKSSEITQPTASGNGWENAEIRIGMLYAGEVKNYIAHVQMGLDTSVSCRNWWAKASISCNHIQDTFQFLETRMLTGDDAGENSCLVERQIVQFKALDFLSSLQTEFNDEKNTAKGDKGAIDAQIRAGCILETRWAQFMENMGDDLKDGIDLDDLHKEVQEMASRLKRGAGMGYICSWVSSQQMQRATTLGSANTVGQAHFLKQAMEVMLYESKKYHVHLPHGGVKLEQMKEAWENLRRQAQDMLNQPTDLALTPVWMVLETAIEKAKEKDVEETIKRGTT